MPIKSERPFTDGSKKGKGPTETDLKRVEFEETPIMSTYVTHLPYFVPITHLPYLHISELC
jgi:hypothetical protein